MQHDPDVDTVHEYGARGDGKTDDQEPIQRALDGPCPVIGIPSGNYLLGDTLRVGSGKRVLAAPDAILKLADGAGRNSGSFILTNNDHDTGNDHIEISGGIWDGNNEANKRGEDGDSDGYTGVAVNFVNVRHLRLADMTIRNPESFSIRLGEVGHFEIEDIRLDQTVSRPNQDGIHLGGFCQDGYIRGIYAVTADTPNDDMVALNADDNVERVLNLGMKCGPIRNIHVEELAAENAYTFVRLLSESQPIEGIRIRNLSGGCRCYAINMDNWAFPAGSGDIRNIDIRHARIAKVPESPGFPMVDIRLGVRDLIIEDFQRVDDGDSFAHTLNIENLKDNLVRIEGVSEEDLKLTSGDAGSAEGTPGPVFQSDKTGRHHTAVTMREGSKLVLTRGGIKRLTINREHNDEE